MEEPVRRSPRIATWIPVLAAWIAAPAALTGSRPAIADTQFHFHGLLDVVAAERGAAFESNLLMRGDSPFDGYGLRAFADATLNPRLQVFTQLVLRDATAPYVDGAYLTFTPQPQRDLHLQAGKQPWAIGTWAPRTYSDRNPLIGCPLMYQYHSTLLWYEIPPNADELLSLAGAGQAATDYFGGQGRGMAIVDDSYWDVSATLSGSARPLEYALGVSAGAPSWGSTSEDDNSGRSVLGRLGFAPLPGVRVGVSGSYGPYLVQGVTKRLPPGKSPDDYPQQLGMADAELLAGHLELRAEGARNVWKTPTLGALGVSSGYAELKYAFAFGGYLAGRWDAIRFADVTDSTGARRAWDADARRVEAGAGYRFDRNVTAKLVWQQTRYGQPVLGRTRVALVGAQLSIAF